MIKQILIGLILVIPFTVSAQETEAINFKEKLIAITNGYFMAYNEHNVDKIIRFYDDSCVLIDANLNHEIRGKQKFRNLARAAFEGTSPLYKDLFFKIYGMEQDGYKVIVKGEMQNLQWNRGYPESWRFVAHIQYNERGKIIEQKDFVEYPEDVFQYLKK